MRFACRRCDWHPDPEDTYGPAKVQLAEHAAETEHWCCIVCHRSLTATEIQTCTECVAQVRKHLVEILERYALLPGELGHATAAPLDGEGGHRDDETPLPGGTVLALLAGGSEGTQWRGRHATSRLRELRTPWAPVQRLRHKGGVWVEDEANDNRHPGDTPSVAFELSRWEDVWREDRNEPAASGPGDVWRAVDYLAGHRLTWAGSHHPAFDEFATDIRGLHRTLTQAVAMDDRPQAGAPCFEFECGAILLRQFGEDHYVCPRCRREYDQPSYWLAVRAELAREQAEREQAERDERERGA